MLKFEINDKQQSKLLKWKKKHDERCRFAKAKNCGAIGCRFTYCFISTSLGVIVKVKCTCGHEIDLTDYRGW